MTKPPKGFKGRNSRGGSARMVFERVKTARRRKSSSTAWLKRQLNDPYVIEAKRRGFRSRAAFKILELNEKFDFLKPGGRIVDLGAAPGGWSQAAYELVMNGGKKGKIVALDIQEMDPIEGIEILHLDFTAGNAPDALKQALGGEADVVMSDMAAPSTGHTGTDHLRIIGLCETALEFAREVLAPGGTFIAKVLQGGTEGELLNNLKRDFKTVRHVKPPASRQDSAEMYVVGLNFKGRQKNAEVS